MKRILMVLMTLAIAVAVPAKSKSSNGKQSSRSSTKTAVMVYTLAGCSDCAALKSYMKRSGVQLVTRYTRDNNVSLYPTVVYSDGAYDHGQRLYARQAKMPKSVKVVETN